MFDSPDYSELGKQAINGVALGYAMGQGLSVPLRSSIYRAIVDVGESVGELGAVYLTLGILVVNIYVTDYQEAECYGLI